MTPTLTVTRIHPNKRMMNRRCALCVGTAAYIVGSSADGTDQAEVCIAHADIMAPGCIPALPADVALTVNVDPLGQETLHDDPPAVADLDCLTTCSTVYRILPDTADATTTWLRGAPWDDSPRHGYTLRGILLDIRETVAYRDYLCSDRPIAHVVVSNYGYSYYYA
jgi:hypothetical protein